MSDTAQRTCSIVGCERPHSGRGWCVMHYKRWKRNGDPSAVSTPAIVAFDRLAALETDDHVLWPKALNAGYGVLRFEEHREYTHRLALMRRGGIPADRTSACHRPGLGCPTHCMNYRHLYWGTYTDNGADMVIDGHSTRGERQPNHVLTEADVREIRRLRATTSLTYAQIADRLGASWLTVRSAATGRNWYWLEEVRSDANPERGRT